MTDGLVPAEIVTHLKVRHSEAHRHYHTWAHIEALLTWLEKAIEQINDPQAVKLAILFHDAIYDPHSTENEAQSADLMMSALNNLFPQEILDRAKTLILATVGHRLPGTADHLLNSDCAFFLDMDLSILGTEPAVFDAYEEAIRREYSFVPPDDYRKGRSAILQDFLDRDRLYFTGYFHDLLEHQARLNLSRSIERHRQD